jgi:flavodoxin I
MSDTFTPIDGTHFVTVPAGNENHSNLAGVRGQLIASGPNSIVRVDFEGHGTLEVSAFDLTEYPAEDGVSVPAEAVADTGAGLNVGIYFGTETGNTQDVAETIQAQLQGCNVTACKDIAEVPVADLLEHEVLLLGVSTWNIGDIQYNWEEKLDELESQSYSGIKVGIFGLGDAAGYPDTFVDGMGILWDRMKETGPELVGIWPSESYDFDESKGMHDESHFLGLVIDEDGEAEMTADRIKDWVAQLHAELGVAVAV